MGRDQRRLYLIQFDQSLLPTTMTTTTKQQKQQQQQQQQQQLEHPQCLNMTNKEVYQNTIQ